MAGPHPGLCATCRHCRLVETGRSVFYFCERSLVDPRYRKYPVLPVVACPGYEGLSCPEIEAGKEEP